ncbi:MAG: nuclear transport factor 2 family protein [Rhizobiaceae bacterium]
MPVSTDDYVAIADHMARYCWAVDEGDEAGWTALWTEDGVFSGVTPEPVTGREALRGVVKMAQSLGPGMMRHSVTNLMCDYIDGERDRVQANYYNLVTHWNAGARMALLALSKVQLVRSGAGWLIARNDTTPLMG